MKLVIFFLLIKLLDVQYIGKVHIILSTLYGFLLFEAQKKSTLR